MVGQGLQNDGAVSGRKKCNRRRSFPQGDVKWTCLQMNGAMVEIKDGVCAHYDSTCKGCTFSSAVVPAGA